MAQWGGNQNYRPSKEGGSEKKKRRARKDNVAASDAALKTSERRNKAKSADSAETEFRVGRTIAGSPNKARQRNLEHIAWRKKRRIRNAFIYAGVLAIIAAGFIFGINYINTKEKEREAQLLIDNPLEPTVAIVDENVGNNISERTKVFVARLEADVKDYDLEIDHVTLPFQKAREILVYVKGRNEYYKMSIDRGSAVQAEDMSRMIRYLDRKELQAEYVDIRVEGRAYYK